MAQIISFKGYRPKKELADKVVSPPYDVLSSDEAREMAKGNNLSFLHVIKPEIDFPENIDLYDKEVYKKGAENLKKLIENKVLLQDEKASLYIYSQRMGSHFQTGIVALASAEEYLADKIKKHEHTKPDKVKDRTTLIRMQGAHSGPVFLTYRSSGEIDNIMKKGQQQTPDIEIVAPSGVEHTLWVINNPQDIKSITEEFKKIDTLYIADGHHRSESAVKNYLNNKTPQTAFFLAVLFPHNQLKVMEYNRVLKDIKGLSKEDFLNKVSENFYIKETVRAEPVKKHSVGMYLDNHWYSLTMKPQIIDENDPVRRLDTAILQLSLLEPILSISDPRTDKRIDFIGGIRGTKELEKLVDSGKWRVAFAMYPVSIDDIMQIADAGKIMPPKSTWFEPKLLSGMVVNIFR